MLLTRITLPLLACALMSCDARRDEPAAAYRLEVTEASPVAVNAPSRLLLSVVAADGGRATRFDRHHGEPMHLIATSFDLEDFQHLHPTLLADGSFTVELRPGRASPYALFAEVSPSDGAGAAQVLRHTLWPAGARGGVARLDDADAFDGRRALRHTTDDTSLVLAPLDAPLEAGVPVALSIEVEDVSEASVQLEEWLGMPAHAIAISPTFRHFLHFHGAFAPAGTAREPGEHDHHAHGAAHGHAAHVQHTVRSSNRVEVHATFPEAGLYKLWVQVKRAGRILTAPFVVQVR